MTELKEHVMPDIAIDDATPTCRVVGAGAEVSGKQGHLYASGISAQSVGAQRIHLQIVKIPPDGRANAHKHDGHETAIYVLSGESGMWYGERLEQHLIARAGEFLYIPARPKPMEFTSRQRAAARFTRRRPAQSRPHSSKPTAGNTFIQAPSIRTSARCCPA